MSAQPLVQPSFFIRTATPDDAIPCGKICYEAFCTINAKHNFPPDFPAPEMSVHVLQVMFSHPNFYCVVAEANGVRIGSNCLDERGVIAGVGPITIDPKRQNQGVGRALMLAVLDRAQQQQFSGVRLVQAAFHSRSLSLYTKLGFLIREPLAVMQGKARTTSIAGVTVRSAAQADITRCDALCERVHGHHRSGEVRDAIAQGNAKVAERNGRVVAYTSGLAFIGHSVAETTEDLCALIASADGFGGPGILLPTRNHELFKWCLENGLRIVEPMTLMTMGLYNEPRGPYLTSISF
jgi:predicted N-acetyltransferase YhbS